MIATREYRIRRGAECDLVVSNPFVSREHASAIKHGEQWYIQDNQSSNGTFMNDSETALSPGTQVPLNESDIIYFSRHYKLPFKLLTKKLEYGGVEEEVEPLQVFQPGEGVIRIGRALDNNVVLGQLSASRYHAEVHLQPDGTRVLKDLGSKIGTYVNDHVYRGKSVPITKEDKIEIGGQEIVMQFSRKPGGRTVVGQQRAGIYLKAEGVSRRVKHFRTGADLDLLSNISLSIDPSEFVGLMGPSGCGKTTFMTALNGCSPFTGKVSYNGVDLTHNLARFAPQIGYVPQDDYMHPELTVRETLFYSARLKFRRDVTDAEIYKKIDSVCRDLDLWKKDGTLDLRDMPIGSIEKKTLSGGQKKRVNLAMELLTEPKILFLDEPTSGLSAADTRNVMELLRKMATDRGIAIVITIHQPSTIVYKMMDKVIYLKQGHLCYYGNTYPDSINYFVSDENPAEAGPDAVMQRMEELSAGQMDSHYQGTSLYKEYVVDRARRLRQSRGSGLGRTPKVPPVQQAPSLFKRYLTCKWRDLAALLLLVGQAPVIGLLVGWIFQDAGLNAPLFLLVFVSLWFGTNNSAKEIVSERSIYGREKRSGLSPSAYLGSKLVVQGLLTFVQCFLLVAASSLLLEFKFFLPSAVFVCWLTSLAGIAIGLCVSALAKTETTAISAIPLVLIPCILFGGMLRSYDDMDGLSRFIASLNPARWGYEAIVQVERDKRKKYDKSPEDVAEELKDSMEVLKQGGRPDEIEESVDVTVLPFRKSARRKSSGYRQEQRYFAFFILGLMSAAATGVCYHHIRNQR